MGSGATHTWVLPSDVTAVVHARRHLAGVCQGMSTEQVEVARLLATELVANAVRHGSGTVVMVVARDSGGLRVEVHDESPAMPVIVELRPLMESGAGLRLVAALASGWGVASRGDGEPGKLVWFALT